MAEDQTSKTMTRRGAFGAVAGGAVVGVAAGLAGGLVIRTPASPPPRPAPSAGARRFVDKVVLITGGTSGIGRAAALAFASEGAKVAFCGRRQDFGRDVEHEIKAKGGEAMYIRADVLIESDLAGFVDATVRKYGRLDVAFNNAGMTIERSLHEYSAAELDAVVHTNLRGVFFAMKYEIPHMLATGGGNIVVTSSSNAIATRERRSAYSASKRGLIGLVQAAALDYAPHGIRVNALVPGTTDTDLVRGGAGMEHVPDALWHVAAGEWAKSHVPGFGRMATPAEIAQFALVLASDEHPYMTGAALVIDGGKTAHAG
jgi:NAD(P)-dependent dehydrogenase (short-subunit alcohol dehydrogenase family)